MKKNSAPPEQQPDAREADQDAGAIARAAAQRQTRQLALQAGEARDRLYEDHPVTRNEVCVVTPPLKEAYGTVESVIVHRDPGTCLAGEFRSGKTTTIGHVVKELSVTFPNLPVSLASAKDHDKFTQNAFFSDLLLDFGHGALNGTANEKRLRCLNTLLSGALQLNSDLHLLMVDEGQNWGEDQWTWMRDVANDLLKKNVKLITITFGQSAGLRKLRTHLIARQRHDLVGRYLLTPREFRGLRDVSELRVTLAAFDDPGQRSYPVGSDISFTEFFMPSAYSGGWRLAHEADRLWNEFSRVAQSKKRVATNIGMNWIGGAIRNFLFSQCLADRPGYDTTPDIWMSAVKASEYEFTLF